MNYEERSDAVKLLFDWNKWLITIETGAIGVMGFYLRLPDLHFFVQFTSAFAILCFLISIILSSFFLLNLPYLLKPEKKTEIVFLSDTPVAFRWFDKYPESGPWKIRVFTKWITRTFGAGISLFSLGLVLGFTV